MCKLEHNSNKSWRDRMLTLLMSSKSSKSYRARPCKSVLDRTWNPLNNRIKIICNRVSTLPD